MNALDVKLGKLTTVMFVAESPPYCWISCCSSSSWRITNLCEVISCPPVSCSSLLLISTSMLELLSNLACFYYSVTNPEITTLSLWKSLSFLMDQCFGLNCLVGQLVIAYLLIQLETGQGWFYFATDVSLESLGYNVIILVNEHWNLTFVFYVQLA